MWLRAKLQVHPGVWQNTIESSSILYEKLRRVTGQA